MVGIVVVSHSARLAEGVAELARQMGGGEVPLAAAGGLDDPDDPIGTDAFSIKEAIESVWSADGVLVLMDLGSAVLNAEAALDFLEPPAEASQVMLCEAPLVEGAVAAVAASGIGATLAEVAAEARSGLRPKEEHLGSGRPRAEAEAPALEGAVTREYEIGNPLGLHLRPAGKLVEALGRFDAAVEIGNATTGAGPAPGRSLSRVSALGIRQGHVMAVSASGPDADGALAAVAELVDDAFGESGSPPSAPVDKPVGEPVPSASGKLTGVAASPGMVVGPARRLHRPDIPFEETPSGSVEEEHRRLEEAVSAARLDIERQREAAERRAGHDEADIFAAHLLILADQELIGVAGDRIDEQTSAARAFQDTIARAAAELRGLDDPYQAGRAADVEAVGKIVLAHLAGMDPTPRLNAAGIVVADDLTPGETAGLDPEMVTGIVTMRGAPTSHSAIIARALGVPAVVAVGRVEIDEGVVLLVDGATGTIEVDPGPARIREAEARIAADRSAQEEAREAAGRPARTADGVAVEVAANIGSPEDVRAALASGADGVGLFRTELLYLNRAEPPTEDEETAIYRRVLDELGDRPLVLRTLDVGGDKPIPYLSARAEDNPFLGVRGIRLGLLQPELLSSQLRAALVAAAGRALRIMFPMVTTLDDWRRARSMVDQALEDLDEPPTVLEVGVMVEVPSLALLAELFAEEVDFFSVGSNDLTQYTLAAERGNPDLAHLSDGLHPAVLSLIRRVCRAADSRGRWVGVCGELAGDPAAIPVLLGLGVRELSMSPVAIPRAKQLVRQVELARAQSLTADVLELADAGEVRERAERFLDEIGV